MADLQVRDLVLDDRDAVLDVRHRSFGPLAPGARAWWDPLYARAVAARRALGAFDADVLVASARLNAYRQVWGGRPVPMAGVAGVVVAPEWRGLGVATLLMRSVLARAVELGDALSVLFPAAVPPYRKMGFEHAAAVSRTTFPAAALRARGAPSVSVRRATLDDTGEIVDLLRRAEATSYDCGPLALTPDDVRELLDDSDNLCYLAGDGFLVFAWDGADLRVERLVAESHQTTRALWALVGSGSSAVGQVYTYQPLHDPVHWILDDQPRLVVQQERWMLRVLDAAAAVAGRGFPRGVTIDVPLHLDDPWIERCAGSFRLQVAGGTGALVAEAEPGSAAVRMGANGFAALYAGTPLATLRNAGLVTHGNAEDDALLQAAFASRPYLIDTF